ncbi:hypothetical protein BN159_0114 [Streptomyces davaonensis JCM 4913]|uniref:Response regulatory domain-containing protein n=1 Tax=Streptomyces davaonensis (strain DSM 101723 / JCM 4913 / KCC S-0913 / 768) TaxID=1214101 RepID=K4QU88_STRDJ|nr:hypothetical protein [Streptomyces davaonensis]CCK24493.1 hypothetical protein BN159_0114 [Streptomyces davaonensis JCM 4913]
MPVTVALARLPELLADMVREAFIDDPWVSIETLRTADDNCLDAAIGREAPDMVIVGVDAASVAEDRIVPCDLLLGHPGLTVLGLSTDGRLAWMCELRPSARPLREVSPTSLREAVHLALRARRR